MLEAWNARMTIFSLRVLERLKWNPLFLKKMSFLLHSFPSFVFAQPFERVWERRKLLLVMIVAQDVE